MADDQTDQAPDPALPAEHAAGHDTLPVPPAQDPAAPVAAVPAPGAPDSSAGPGVRTAQAASPEDGIEQGDKAEGSDPDVTTSGAWTAIAAPGRPDGEVDTRPS